MRKLVILAAAAASLSIAALAPTAADASGCYRLGLTGYHWYGFCGGPDFIPA
jgi:opacity protein-like surface antigen